MIHLPLLVLLTCLIPALECGKKLTDIEALDITWLTMEKIRQDRLPGSQPTTDFYEGAFVLMKFVAQAHAASIGQTRSKLDLDLLRNHLSYALSKRNFVSVRERLGKTMVAFFDVQPGVKTTGRRTNEGNNRVDLLSDGARSFLGAIVDDIGPEIYDQIIVRDGDKTLVFVIDESGSMANEIRTAKNIATSIINESRNGNVSYILSAFSDPDVKPAIFMGPENRKNFVQEILRLTPSGGGDCPELAFTGIINALNAGPKYGSQLIVFTDASPKDATPENLETAVTAAQSLGVTVTFFTALNGCDKERSNIEPFRKLASKTKGQVFALKNDYEMLLLSGYVQDNLKGRTLVEASSSSRNSSSVLYETKSFEVDHTVEVLDISITTEGRTAKHIYLKRPDGVVVKPTAELTQSLQYKIEKPMPGTWNLTMQGKVGRNDMVIKGTSSNVIEFGYFFQFESGRTISPIEHPLLQYETIIRVMLGGVDHVDTGSLMLYTINSAGKVLQGPINVYPIGTTGSQHEAYINVQTNASFQLQLRGRTKSGLPFLRIAPNFEEPKSALLQVLYARKDYTVSKDETTFIVLEVRNFGEKDVFTISFSTSDGHGSLTRTQLTLHQNRSGFSGLNFEPRATLEPGQPAVIFVTAQGQHSGIVVKNVIRLLIVPKDRSPSRM